MESDQSFPGELHGGPEPARCAVSPSADLSALDGFPQVAEMLQLLVEADRLTARTVDLLVDLTACTETDACTDQGACNHGGDDRLLEAAGVSLAQWLAIVARKTSTDIRMLRTAAMVCSRIPSLRAGFVDGCLSWAQVRSVALMCSRLPRHVDDAIDAAVAPVVELAAELEPNAVVSAVRQAIASVDPATITTPQPEPRDFLAMQPRSDGHGGQLFGEMGAESWARLDAVLNTPQMSDKPANFARSDRRGALSSIQPDNRPDAGRRRLARLLGLLEDVSGGGIDCAAAVGPHEPLAPTQPRGRVDANLLRTGGMRSRPQVLVRAELDTLLSRSDMPGVLLTRMLGGKVWADAATTRRLINERGADLRAVIVDCGRVVGVGRRTRVPPDWLQDAMLAIHDTCAAPGCDQPARAADIDHAAPWHPVATRSGKAERSGQRRPGRTDLDELAPVCAHHNRRKERDGWEVTQHPDHSRTWSHPRSGLATTTVPATWQAGHRSAKPPPGRGERPTDTARESRASYAAPRWQKKRRPSMGMLNSRDPCGS